LNLLISAGEASGDMHGARLLAALRARRPDLGAFGMGGPRLRAAGLSAEAASEDISVVGISEVVEKLPVVARSLRALDARAARERPDAAVLIDFPDFHGLLARRLERRGVPLLYYVSPQVWAWRRGRARKIARRARRIITLFPFEADIYRRLGADAVCAGHPIVDDVREGLAVPSPLPPPARRRLLLLPGSRRSEVRRHWEPMLAAAQRLSRRFDMEVVVVRAAGLPASAFAGAQERGFRVCESGMHPLLASSDLAFVASGTATLEAALCGTPMVVLYKTSVLTHAVARLLVRIPWICLVNIVAGAGVVPELLQGNATPERLEREAGAILDSPERIARMREELARVASLLGPPGASDRAAEAVLSALEPAA